MSRVRCLSVSSLFAYFISFCFLLSPIVLHAQSQNQQSQNQQSQNQPCDAPPGEYLIKVRDTSEVRSLTLRQKGAYVADLLRTIRTPRIQRDFTKLVPGLRLVKTDPALGDIDRQKVQALMQEEKIEYVQPNCKLHAVSPVVPNDSSFSTQWGLHNVGQQGGAVNADIDAPEAWETETGATTQIIAVVDSGVDYSHPDLAENMWTNPLELPNGIDDDQNGVVDDFHGYNAVDQNGDPFDFFGHGTHVAGIAGASGNDGSGITGVNWSTRIMAVRVLNDVGEGRLGDILAGLQYIAQQRIAGQNVRVVNASLGASSSCPGPVFDALQALQNLGILFVAAAGNDGSNNDDFPFIPASCDNENVIAVAAIDRFGLLASFSNYGAASVHVAAPGVSILSTLPFEEYKEWSGTSMAAPFVAGVAALVLSHEPNLTLGELRGRLLGTTKGFTDLEGKILTGGVISAYQALHNIPSSNVPSSSSSSSSTSSSSSSSSTSTSSTSSSGGLPSYDSDGDGVTDRQETLDGTNPKDPGSISPRLRKAGYSLWNGFFNTTCVLEVLNTELVKATAHITLYRHDGSKGGTKTIVLKPRQQVDVVLNNFPGFESNRYGIVKVRSDQVIDGRTVHYNSGENTPNNQFVYSVPLSNPSYGQLAVPFNTQQPGILSEESSNLVSNWLSVVNLSNEPQSFVVEMFDVATDNGLVAIRQLDVPAFGRIDIEAGHLSPGVNHHGTNLIVPENWNSPYLAYLTRYGHVSAQATNDFNFAVSLQAKFPTKEKIFFPLRASDDTSSGTSSDTWLEVLGLSKTIAHVRIYGEDGTLKAHLQEPIDGIFPRHISLGNFLSPGEHGYVVVRGASVGNGDHEPLLANSISYDRSTSDVSPNSLSLLSAHTPVARQSLGNRLFGTYNQFLQGKNSLHLSNTSSKSITVKLKLYQNNSTDKPTVEHSLKLKSHETEVVSLENNSIFGVPSNTYGVLSIKASKSGALIADVFRSREAFPNFHLPIELR